MPFTSAYNAHHKHKQNLFHSSRKLFDIKGGARGGGTDSSMTEFYDILGLQKGKCSEKDIKKAYREKAMKMHPDRGGDTEEFKKLAEAYEVTYTITILLMNLCLTITYTHMHAGIDSVQP